MSVHEELISQWADSGREFAAKMWGLTEFTLGFWRSVVKRPYEIEETVRQMFYIGYKSLPVVGMTGLVIGIVLALQSKPTMTRFGAESLIPAMTAIAIVREIGPVIIALIFAGKIGSGIGAELGAMNVTEQIAAMEISAVNPFNYLVVTRVVATTLMLPLLVFYADCIALFGGFIALSVSGDMGFELYFSQVFNSLRFPDVIPAVIKTVAFGFAIGIVGCYEGYNSSRGTESVGRAANTAVVTASFIVIFIDMVVVQVSNVLGQV